MRPWIPAVAAVLALASAATPPALAAQQARGVVVDASSGVPIPEATVTLLDTAAHALVSGRTDGAGVFTILAPAPAPYLVTVRRLGYESFTSPELVLGVRDTTLRVALVPSPQRLAPSVTRGRRGLFAREWGRDGFIRRRELGAGVFLTRFDVLLQEPEYLEEAFRDIDGLQVVGSGTGLQVRSLRGQRCLKVLINRLPLPRPMRGVPQPTGFELLPKHILGIEVYREFDEVPEELRTEAHPCGLINLWTRAAWAPRPPKPTKAGAASTPRP